MLFKTMHTLTKVALFVSALTLFACNGGGGSSSGTTSTPGNLVITNASSATSIAIGGTQQYVVSLANSANLAGPVAVAITSSNPQVALIQSNSCATTGLTATQSCTFYVKGVSAGSANVMVSGSGYQAVTEPVIVAQQWGTFSNQLTQDNHPFSASQLSFGGDYIYALGTTDVIRSNGGAWQNVGGGTLISKDLSVYQMTANASHVCVNLNYQPVHGSISTMVKCSKDGAVWSATPTLTGYHSFALNLYQGTLYLLAERLNDLSQSVMTCPVDNCSSWQQQGESLPYRNTPDTQTFFESTAYVQNRTGTYYQISDGSWQLYASYSVSSSGGDVMAANTSGVVLMPLDNFGSVPYIQPVYYNGTSNIGGTYAQIGGGVGIINFEGYSINALAMSNNSLFVEPGDGHVYTSVNSNGGWSNWSQVGLNSTTLDGIYYNDNKVYSIELLNNLGSYGSQVYVYSLN